MPPDTDVRVVAAELPDMVDWDDYVRAADGSSVYHLSVWRKLIEDVFGRQTFYLMAKNSAGIRGVLPLVRLKSWFFGDFLVSMPYVSYGGVVADNRFIAEQLLSHCAELADQLGVEHVELRHAADCSDLPRRTEKVAMQLVLTGDSEQLWKQLGAKRRAQIKRPVKEGAEHQVGGSELVDDFYSVFSRKYRDLGVPVYPVKWFRSVLEAFPDRSRVFVVRMNGQPVAASIVIGFKGVLEVPWAGSLRSADRFGVNMYLYWCMLEFAEQKGYQTFDFGRSTEGSGTFRFKKQWGAKPVQLYWHYWLRDRADIPHLNPANPKYQAAVAVWQRLPVWMTNRIGPQIVKNLP